MKIQDTDWKKIPAKYIFRRICIQNTHTLTYTLTHSHRQFAIDKIYLNKNLKIKTK